jgi:hypothetical protein
MGKYDIPASIDYVLNTTEENKLAAYFGYSLGVGTFLMGAIQHSELNDKVEVMIGLGPTVNVAHLNNFFRYMAPFVKIYQVSTTHIFGMILTFKSLPVTGVHFNFCFVVFAGTIGNR